MDLGAPPTADKTPWHIVHCLSALSLGGSELATLELAEGQRQAGHRVTLVAQGGPLVERCREAGVAHLEWPIGAKRLASLRYIRRLRRWFIEEQVDVVHAQARLPAWIAKLALRGIPQQQRPAWLTTIHGQYSLGRYSRVMTQGDGVIAVSQAMADWAHQLNPQFNGVMKVVYGGIDPDYFNPGFEPEASWLRQFETAYPQLEGKQLLSLVARGTRLKNHAGFIRLIAGLRAQGINAAGLLVGGFSVRRQHYRRELEQLCQELGVTDSIIFLGDRQDVRELMSVSDLIVNISTKAEAFGRTLVEALALGRPVLSWDRGGASEILAQVYPTGAVPADDEAQLLQRAMALLFQAPKPSPVPFSLHQTTRETLAFYRQVLANQARHQAAQTPSSSGL